MEGRTAFAAFAGRANQIFAVLDATQENNAAAAAPWALSSEQVFRPGRDQNEASSDEEADAEEVRRRRELLPGSMLDFEDEGEEDGAGLRDASAAFCKALDNEEEYDALDQMAGRTLRGNAAAEEPRPPLNTEVLDDNIWDQRCSSKSSTAATELSAPAAMEVEKAPPAAPSQPATGPSTSSQMPKAGQKRVHFDALCAPPHHRVGVPAPHSAPQASTSAAAHTPVVHQQRGRRGRSVVPDHVKNPHKYTCYALDEPLVVGGGDQEGASGLRDMEQAARAAMSAAASTSAAPEKPEGLPEFGKGGIMFRPTSKSKSSNSHAAAAPRNSQGAAGPVTIEEIEEEVPAGGSVAAHGDTKPADAQRHRHYRRKIQDV